MRTHHSHILATYAATALVALLTACSNETFTNQVEVPRTGKLITITATSGTPGDAGTRTVLKDGSNMQTGGVITVGWKAGNADNPTDPANLADAFEVFYGTSQHATFTIDPTTVTEGVKAADFSGTVADGASGTGKAFYPAAKACKQDGSKATTFNECVFNMTGQVQRGAYSTAHLSDYDYKTADITNIANAAIESISFESQVAIFKFVVTMPGGETPTSITLRTTNDDIVLKQSADGGTTFQEKSNELSLQLLNPVAEGGTATYSTFTAYMAVLPFTVNGATFEIEIATAARMKYSFTATTPTRAEGEKTFAAGKVYDIVLNDANLGSPIPIPVMYNGITAATAPTEGTGADKDHPYLIETPAHLAYFFANCGDKKHYKLMTDMDIIANGKEVTIDGTPQTTTQWSAINVIKGSFDGNNKTLGGSLENVPNSPANSFALFYNSEATISNLTLAFNIKIDMTYNTSFYSSYSISGICRNNDFGIITNCTNNSHISITNAASTDVYFGGICRENGKIIGGEFSGTIINCVSNCTVTVTEGGSVSPVLCGYFGGICERNSGTITGCYNYSHLSVSKTGTSMTYIGGICGSNRGTIASCTNFGKISGTNNAASGSPVRVGGICGTIDAGDFMSSGGTMYCCTNSSTGIISVAGTGTGTCGGLVGYWYDTTNWAAKIYKCCLSASAQPANWIGARASGDGNLGLDGLTPCEGHTH